MQLNALEARFCKTTSFECNINQQLGRIVRDTRFIQRQSMLFVLVQYLRSLYKVEYTFLSLHYLPDLFL